MTPLDIARSQLGVREASGRNDGIPAERYLDGQKGLEWCAAFTIFCFREAGCPLPGNRWKNRAVSELQAQLVIAGAEVDAADVQPGDIIVLTRTGGLHVGIVEKVHKNSVATIEGNVDNRVARRHHFMNSQRLVGFYRWPVPERLDAA